CVRERLDGRDERSLEAVEAIRVRDRELRLVRQAGQQAQRPLEVVGIVERERRGDATVRAVVENQRCDEVRDLRLQYALEAFDVTWLELERLAAQQQSLNELAAVPHLERLLALLLRVTVQGTWDELAGVGILDPDGCPLRADDAG